MNADKILSNSKCPNTIAVLRMPSGNYRIGYNRQGIQNDEIQKILDELGNVNMFNRQCAEVNGLFSAYTGEDSLQGAEIYVTYLYRIGQKEEWRTGNFKDPCEVCEPLLQECGVKIVRW